MTDELHTLSGAYAVHALPYAEWVLYEEHLLACPACWAEVRRLRETAARLAEAVAEPPPAALRQRLLHAAHELRRPEKRPEKRPEERPVGRPVERPVERPGRGSGAVPDDSPTIWRPPVSRAPAAPPAALPVPPPVPPSVPPSVPAPVPPSIPEDSPTLRIPPEQPAAFRTAPELPAAHEGGQVLPLRRRRARLTAGLAAGATAAAVALGAVAVDARRDLSDLTARHDEVIAVLAAPDAETVRRPATSGGTGTVVISRARGRMVFASSGLAELPRSKGYELWLMGPDGPRPAGMLGRAEGGLTTPLLITPERGDVRVALTVEPAAGSGRPTTRPILLAELPEA
ncbi:anti-sigma factor [Nonomuraea jabiensis]|uniref:anti-sigma factor n=1 Tax=Nonomuraea jabiensis TaxID=882448 RepID=UPI00341433CF